MNIIYSTCYILLKLSKKYPHLYLDTKYYKTNFYILVIVWVLVQILEAVILFV